MKKLIQKFKECPLYEKLLFTGFFALGIALVLLLISGFIYGWDTEMTAYPIISKIIIILYTYHAITFTGWLVIVIINLFKRIKKITKEL